MNSNSANTTIKSKQIRCFCNDKNHCYNSTQCTTNTMCMTKKVRLVEYPKPNELNNTKLIYYCGEPKESNSFRADFINFRDCNINTRVAKDYKYAIDNHEYCCDTYDECNRHLKPYNSRFELSVLMEEQQLHKQKVNASQHFYDLGTLNIILLSSLIVLVLMAFIISLIALLIYTKRNRSSSKLKATAAGTIENHPFIEKSVNLNEKFCLNFNVTKFFRKKSFKTTTSLSSQSQLSGTHHTQLHQGTYYISNSVVNSIVTPITQSSTLSDSQKSSFMDNDLKSNYIISSGRLYPQNGLVSDSGSGSGNPICVPRTIARDIKLLETVGIGRYGEVHRGKWTGEEYVAVKTFNSAEENSWKNEINIYLTQCLRDENILGFIAADIIDTGFSTQLWIITEFHENKSLYDYLTMNSIDLKTCLNMALSIVKGLKHLHMSIKGCTGKLALAHCDLKSKNILVKSNLTCCIGDLGLAIAGDIDGNIDQANVIRSGTKRYMAPEILVKSIESSKIEAYQKADMYSLSLVYWELLNRSKLNTHSQVNEYAPPLNEHLPLDPNENLVKHVVCELKLRPTIDTQWKTNRITNDFASLLEELWSENPDARLNALRVKKSIDKFKSDMDLVA